MSMQPALGRSRIRRSRRRQADKAVERLFPPPPDPADLHQPDTAYALTASEVLYEMEDELTEPTRNSPAIRRKLATAGIPEDLTIHSTARED
jgi:hypothetical protein